MTAVDATALTAEELQAKAWDGFVEGDWQKDIDVRGGAVLNLDAADLMSGSLTLDNQCVTEIGRAHV